MKQNGHITAREAAVKAECTRFKNNKPAMDKIMSKIEDAAKKERQELKWKSCHGCVWNS